MKKIIFFSLVPHVGKIRKQPETQRHQVAPYTSTRAHRYSFHSTRGIRRKPLISQNVIPCEIKNTAVLTVASLLCRLIGFYYKIFLASLIGAEGIGIYQMVFPIFLFCTCLASSGMQTAISRFTAESLSLNHPARARAYFSAGLTISLTLSGISAALLYLAAPFLASRVLADERCLSLLRLMAAAIPLETIHSCTCAYFLGQKKSAFPALSQLAEQLARTGSTFLLFYMLYHNNSPSALLAVSGLIAGESAAAILSLAALIFDKTQHRSLQDENGNFQTHPFFDSRQLLSTAVPVTGNRLMISFLQSAEAALLPLCLTRFYQESSAALSSYGMLTGMALPLVLFPTAITGSYSLVLLPSVSEASARQNGKKIAAMIRSSLLFSLYLGVLCTSAFLLFGPSLGNLLYHREQVGNCLMTLAWICPFLYLSSTISSILHGLGKTMRVFWNNFAGIMIRLCFILLLVPRFGVNGYLWGLLGSQLVTALLGLTALRYSTVFSFPALEGILLPAALCLGSACPLMLLQKIFPVLASPDSWQTLLISAMLWGGPVLMGSVATLRRLFQYMASQGGR